MIYVVAVLLFAVLAAATVSLVRWRAEQRAKHAPIPLVFPMNSGIAWDTALSSQPMEPLRSFTNFGQPVDVVAPRDSDDRAVDVPLSVDRDQAPLNSETVRFQRPPEEVVQLLPGHLEVLSGDPRHHEIRFVRVQGQQPQLILGRNPGRSPQHIALNSSTVSRQHARLAFAGGKWAVANLSKTNPVVVNNVELSNVDGERQLSDGDRIELGEVVMRFHAH